MKKAVKRTKRRIENLINSIQKIVKKNNSLENSKHKQYSAQGNKELKKKIRYRPHILFGQENYI